MFTGFLGTDGPNKEFEEMARQDEVTKLKGERKDPRSSRVFSSIVIGVLLMFVNLPIAAAGLLAFAIRLAMRSAKSVLRLPMPCEPIAGRFDPDRAST